MFIVRIQDLFRSGFEVTSKSFGLVFVHGLILAIEVDPLGLVFQNYLKISMLKFQSHWWIILLNFLVLMFERESYIFIFLNNLNLTYRRLTGFVMSFKFIPIELVSWNKFLLCYTHIRSILAFRNQISILIVDCVTTWSQDSH